MFSSRIMFLSVWGEFLCCWTEERVLHLPQGCRKCSFRAAFSRATAVELCFSGFDVSGLWSKWLFLFHFILFYSLFLTHVSLSLLNVCSFVFSEGTFPACDLSDLPAPADSDRTLLREIERERETDIRGRTHICVMLLQVPWKSMQSRIMLVCQRGQRVHY